MATAVRARRDSVFDRSLGYNAKFLPRDGSLLCGSGGIGRRASLRSLCPQGRGGSSPLFRTISIDAIDLS